jgi:transposase
MQLKLTSAQRRRLYTLLKSSKDVRQYRRVMAILQVAQGRPVTEIAALIGVSRATLYCWLDAFRADPRPENLQDRPRSGRPRLRTELVRAALGDALQHLPSLCGYVATEWTVPLLQDHLERLTDRRLSEDTIRRELHEMGYAWKRPRYTLLPDPEQEKKAPSSSATG